jgi:Flp pilus assembly protein TadD
MKRIALVAAVFALAACTKTDDTPAVDTAAMAPAPAAMDTTMPMMDTTSMMDTTMKADTTKK